MILETTINDQLFTMHSSGALFWNEKNTLLIADVHLGKVTHFRKNGFAIPNDALHKNFEKLIEVVDFFKASTILFLGDLFHSTKNSEWDLFVKWSKECTCEIVLIVGNHDIIDAQNYINNGIKVVDYIRMDDFLLTHHPTEVERMFNFSGHIHPGIVLRGLGRGHLKLPCFFQRKNQMILPAFGAFTGLGIMKPQEGDTIFAVTKEEIVLIRKSVD
ncbi:ligase-associated DNA damage response endonuclease PdeM [Flavobacterium antarcticum]|uniref:ligase-associated DNA damage response endonuclease PdeM n=1 Tax=Flavobacterium antarcticum TaxID=271155 RepID=UPI0003B59B3C|nr:ligase-associated DNA damage response endonuclease PdeM [Flavobacterium antarcticum]